MPKFSKKELAQIDRQVAESNRPKKRSKSAKEIAHVSSFKEKLVAPLIFLFTVLLSYLLYLLKN